jgi:hypothetical protein
VKFFKFILVTFLMFYFEAIAKADYFEFTLDASTHATGRWGQATKDGWPNWTVKVNGKVFPVHGHSFSQPILVGRTAPIDKKATFLNGINTISASFGGFYLAGVTYKLHFVTSTGSSRICNGVLRDNNINLLDCGNIQLTLEQIDPQSAHHQQEAEKLKKREKELEDKRKKELKEAKKQTEQAKKDAQEALERAKQAEVDFENALKRLHQREDLERERDLQKLKNARKNGKGEQQSSEKK